MSDPTVGGGGVLLIRPRPRSAPALAALLALAASLAASAAPAGIPATGPAPENDAQACGLLVCATATSTLSVGCWQGFDSYTAQHVLGCDARLSASGGGSSPAFLPGEAAGTARAQIHFHCTPDPCAPMHTARSASLAAAWGGGPITNPTLGLAPGATDREDLGLHARAVLSPTTDPAVCIHYDITLTTAVTATVVRVGPAGATVPVEQVTATDVAHVDNARGPFCMA